MSQWTQAGVVLFLVSVLMVSGCPTNQNNGNTRNSPQDDGNGNILDVIKGFETSCEGRSDELKIVDWAITPETNKSKFTLQNTSGKPISIEYIFGSGDLSGEKRIANGTVKQNETFVVTDIVAGNPFSYARLIVNYGRQDGTAGVVNFVCTGK